MTRWKTEGAALLRFVPIAVGLLLASIFGEAGAWWWFLGGMWATLIGYWIVIKQRSRPSSRSAMEEEGSPR